MPHDIDVCQPGCVRACFAGALRAADVSPSTTVKDLPEHCLTLVLTKLPACARARAACVCVDWRDALRAPSAWRDVFFEAEQVTPETLAAVCARSAGSMARLLLPEGCTALRPTSVLDAVRLNPRLRQLRALALRLPWSGTLVGQALELAPSMECLEVDAFLVEGVPAGTELALESSADDESSGGALVQALASHKVAVRFLHVAGRIWLRSLEALATALAGGARVRSLHLAFADVNDDGAAVLSAGLRGIGSLYELNLRANNVRHIGCTSLAAGLAGGLRRLCLASNAIGREGAAALGAALPSCALEMLDVSGCSIDTAGCIALASGVGRSTTLQELLIGFNRLGPAGAAALASALAAPTSKLTVLDLEWTSAGSAGAEAIGRALLQRGARAVQRIGLASNGIGSLAAVPLSVALASAILHTLVLTNNAGLGNGGAAALAAGLRQQGAVLSRLELGACGIRAAGAVALARALACPTAHLCALNLAENNVGAEGVLALTTALRKNHTLIELSLSVGVARGEPARAAEVTLRRTPGRRPGPWRGAANVNLLP